MSLKPIECANCGAQYRLPETFKADKAKCKKCGATIDVAGQRNAPPAEEKPAEKKPAARPSARRAASAKRASKDPEKPSRTSRIRESGRRREASKGGYDEDTAADRRQLRNKRGGSSRRGGTSSRRRRGEDADETPQKSKTPLFVGGGIGLVAVIVVVLVFAMGGGETPQDDTTANAEGTVPAAEGNKPEEGGAKATEAVGDGEEGTPAEASANGDGGDAGEGAGKESSEPDAKPAEKPEKKPIKKTSELKEPADVYDPRKELEPLEWPDSISAEQRTEIEELLVEVRGSGLPGQRAKDKLEKIGHPALLGIINALREFNYLDSDDTMSAFELNRLLTRMTAGLHFNFKEVNIGDEIPLETAHYNAKTAKTWQSLWNSYSDPEKFQEMVEKRRKKSAGK